MPLYEYECMPCLVVYETMHGMNDPAPDRCPKRWLTAPKDLRAEDQSLQLFEPDRGEIREGFRARRNRQGTRATEGIRAHLAPAASPAQPLGLADFGSDRPCITEVRFIERGILK